MTKTVIIGAGEIGQAINYLLTKGARTKTFFWDKDPSKVPNQLALEELLSKANLVFLCIPSPAVGAVLKDIKPLLRAQTAIVSLTKGIEKDGSKTMDEVLESNLPAENIFGLLSGPMIAEEILRGRKASAVLATSHKRLFTKIRKLFPDDFQLDYSKDKKGVALAGVLKNVYSVGLGIVDGLELGSNFKGWYVKEVCAEMMVINAALGGKKETVLGLAGIGDFIATGFSKESKNYQAGLSCAKDDKCQVLSEGIYSLPSLAGRLKEVQLEPPILKGLEAIVSGNKKATEVFKDFIKA